MPGEDPGRLAVFQALEKKNKKKKKVLQEDWEGLGRAMACFRAIVVSLVVVGRERMLKKKMT